MLLASPLALTEMAVGDENVLQVRDALCACIQRNLQLLNAEASVL